MNNEERLEALNEISKSFNERMKEVENESEEYYNSLTKEQQLKVFCAISRRIYKGEIEDQRSYRGVLYDVFQFGPEAYAPAQMAGYLTIHNSIVSGDYDSHLIKTFCRINDIEVSEQKIDDFLIGRL